MRDARGARAARCVLRGPRGGASAWELGGSRAGTKGRIPSGLDAGALLALAFPERLAEQRGARGRFRMANGSGARLDEADPLASEAFLAIGEVQGGGPDARILLAAPIDRPTIEELFPGPHPDRGDPRL